ncbi:lymphocyte function-associated antigen 3 isoform X3 [Bos taurus]|uniref:lymphocyte function-associated antigen 3 isoform X3 n=1 Tax=Bos taurus TaxID=9913 RepID=UPI0028CB4916|nr:lymphocyte function-associated antigen 3 isoform X3 [Bos taurus]XP_005204121.2 lymphocyte function-associated antigen 3 isoform X3 [Bos taurus]
MAGTTGTRTESARRGKDRRPDCIRCQPAARQAGRGGARRGARGGAGRERRGGAREAGLALRQTELCGCEPLAETARTAMAAGSAPGWALGVLGVVYLFLKLDFISCSQEIYGAMNGNVTFYVSKFHPSTEIIWKKEKNKVVEWDIQSGLEAFQSFKDRVYLDIGSGNLTITRLTKSDEGLYELESPGVRNKSEFHLKVIAPPPSPSTFCSLSDDGNITLTCEIMEAGYDIDGNLLQYSWECPPTVQCHRGLSPSEAYVLKKSDLSQNVQCIVSNPLFRTSASISLSTCVPEDNTRHRFSGTS